VYPLYIMVQDSNDAASNMQIGEVARLTALTVDAIRYYERRALLPKARRSPGRFRLYCSEHVGRLVFIRQMQGLGFSLREIRQLLDLREHNQEACHEVKDLLKNKLEMVRSKIRKLEQLEHELVLDLRKCNRELADGNKQASTSCPILSRSPNGRKRGAS